jgi:3-phosphoshikimate 1-carboxyvinyltransferase
MSEEFSKINRVSGTLELPGDKSISHRAVIFSSLAKGNSAIRNLSDGLDVYSTISCFKSLGVDFEGDENSLTVNGRGLFGLKKPSTELNCGNSGTTARLISGILAMQKFESTIIGDKYLSKRPMKRIIAPLQKMGANIKYSENMNIPLTFIPSQKLCSIKYELPEASAQVKSAVLLAGLHLKESTSVIEKVQSRDHTERMLNLNSKKSDTGTEIFTSKNYYPDPAEYFIPSDLSTASFFIVLTLLTPNSELKIKNVSLNNTRTGVLEVLKTMGAKIEIENEYKSVNEPYGDLLIKSSKLKNITIPQKLIPNIIDEIPVLSVAGLFAEGDFVIRNAKELRVKESDRLNSLCYNYAQLGLEVEEYEDGFSIKEEIKNNHPFFESFNDHRIAMTFGLLSSLLQYGGKVNNFTCVGISNPGFLKQLKSIVR